MRRVALFGAALLLLVTAALWLVWTSAGSGPGTSRRLDALVPADVEAAVRVDGPDCASSPLLRWLRSADAAEPLREALGWEGLLAAIAQVDESIRAATGGKLTLEADVAPGEVVVAVRRGGVLALSRVSAAARIGDALLRPDPAALAAQGIDADGTLLRVRGADLWLARSGDVLVAATERSLADDALALDAGRGDALSARPGFDDALALGGPAAGRAFVWADAASLGSRLRGGAQGMRESDAWFALWEAAGATLRGTIDLRSADSCSADFAVCGAALPPALAPLRGAGVPDATVTAALAAPFVVPSETFAWGGLPMSAKDAVLLLLRALPPEHVRVLTDELSAKGETLESAAARIASPLADGIGFAVARVAEADRVDDGGEPGSVRRIPATTIVFAVRDGRRADEALATVKSLGASLVDVDPAELDVPGRSVRLHVADRSGFLGQWELLRPAVLTSPGRLVFTTHEGHLRRALRARTAEAGSTGGASMRLSLPLLRRQLDDEGWNHAQSVCVHDWGAERRAFEAEVRAAETLSPGELADRADREIRNRMRVRRERELPLACEDFRDRWRWLAPLGGASIDLSLVPRGAEYRLRVTLAK
ncbi:MAG: hypothetical protein HMLKMBBP_02683 [Planctomycetes bacterium]|nr:hypothetical protein [Planctomycetota bacterium]